MRFEGAIIKEQGVTFGIMIVKNHVLDNPLKRDELVAQASQLFGGIPTVLMGRNYQGRPRYYGRTDIVKFMAPVPLAAIPWKEYTFT